MHLPRNASPRQLINSFLDCTNEDTQSRGAHLDFASGAIFQRRCQPIAKQDFGHDEPSRDLLALGSPEPALVTMRRGVADAGQVWLRAFQGLEYRLQWSAPRERLEARADKVQGFDESTGINENQCAPVPPRDSSRCEAIQGALGIVSVTPLSLSANAPIYLEQLVAVGAFAARAMTSETR